MGGMPLERIGGCTGKQPVGGVRYGRTVSKFMEIRKNGNESRVFFRSDTHPGTFPGQNRPEKQKLPGGFFKIVSFGEAKPVVPVQDQACNASQLGSLPLGLGFGQANAARAAAMRHGFGFVFEKHPVSDSHPFARPAIEFAVDFQFSVAAQRDFACTD